MNDDEPIETRFLDDREVALVQSMVGRTIVAARWYDAAPWEFGPHETGDLTLDDGRVIRFSGWGDDGWGGTVEEVTD